MFLKRENVANNEKTSETLHRRKLWIRNHRKENPKITQNKIALDFSAKLKKKQLADSVSSEFLKKMIDSKLLLKPIPSLNEKE